MYEELLITIIGIALLITIAELCRDKTIEVLALRIITACYVAALIYITMIRGGRNGLGGVNFRFPLAFYRAIQRGRYNGTTNRSVENILLFIPCGYLLSRWICSRTSMKLWKVTLLGFLSSLLIETIQLVFHRGVFEIDDLVKNTLGSMIGYGIWKTIG